MCCDFSVESCMTCDFKSVIILFYRKRRKRLESPW
nr:MAG TPA: hypothetical protein [Caudoviricetes sp.]